MRFVLREVGAVEKERRGGGKGRSERRSEIRRTGMDRGGLKKSGGLCRTVWLQQ